MRTQLALELSKFPGMKNKRLAFLTGEVKHTPQEQDMVTRVMLRMHLAADMGNRAFQKIVNLFLPIKHVSCQIR